MKLLEQNKDIDKSSFSFLHISDTHASDYTLNYFVRLLEIEDYQFGILTGDIYLNKST